MVRYHIEYATQVWSPQDNDKLTLKNVQRRATCLVKCIENLQMLKGIYLSKALTCMKNFLYQQELLFFVNETDTFGHIVV